MHTAWGSFKDWRTDHGREFTAAKFGQWPPQLDLTTLLIKPGRPWQDGYLEPFMGKPHNELLYVEIFETILEQKGIIES